MDEVEMIKLQVPEGAPLPLRSHNGDGYMPDGYGYIWAERGQVQSLAAQGCVEIGERRVEQRHGHAADAPDTLQPITTVVIEGQDLSISTSTPEADRAASDQQGANDGESSAPTPGPRIATLAEAEAEQIGETSIQ